MFQKNKLIYLLILFISILTILFYGFQFALSALYMFNSDKIEDKIAIWITNLTLPEEVDRYLWLDKVEFKGNDVTFKFSFESNCTADIMQLVLESHQENYSNELPDLLVDFLKKGYNVSFKYFTYDGELVDEMVIPIFSSTKNNFPSKSPDAVFI